MADFNELRKKYSEIMTSAWVNPSEFVAELKKLEGESIDLQETGKKSSWATLISVDQDIVIFERNGKSETLPINKVRCFSTHSDFLCQRKK